MDNLTHTLTALMMSRCGLGKTLPRGGPLMLMLAANAPDIDGIPGLGNAVRYLSQHRGYPHALILSPVLAILPLAVICLFTRTKPNWRALLASWLAVLSHLLLDWTNVYGTRLLLPFNANWYHLDITDVVDPWIWLALLLALAAPALAGLIGSEIASARKQGPKKSWAVFALIVIVCYEGVRFVSHARAMEVMQAHIYASEKTPSFTAVPTRFTPLRWRGIVSADEFVINVSVDVTESYNPADGRIDYPTKSSPAIDAAKTTHAFQVFGDFNQVPFWRVVPEGDLIRVDLIDLRFGTPQRPGFMATARVTSNGQIEDSRFAMGPIPVR